MHSRKTSKYPKIHAENLKDELRRKIVESPYVDSVVIEYVFNKTQ